MISVLLVSVFTCEQQQIQINCMWFPCEETKSQHRHYEILCIILGIRHADHVAPSIRKSWQSLLR
jgi:hypothetical protein